MTGWDDTEQSGQRGRAGRADELLADVRPAQRDGRGGVRVGAGHGQELVSAERRWG